MLEGVASEIVFLATSAWISLVLLGRWMPKDVATKVTESFLAKGRSDRWSHAASMLLVTALNHMLGNKVSDNRKIFRTVASAFAILLLTLSIAGSVSNTFLGFTESPWRAYDSAVAGFLKVNNLHETKSPEEKKATEEMSEALLAASAPHWKYVYAVCAIPVTLFLYLGVFFLSARMVLRLIEELNAARTWIQKAGVTCFSAVLLPVWAIILILAFAFFSSPLTFFGVSLAHNFSTGWVVAGAFAIAAFEFYFSGAWFKALLLASVLPGVGFLLLVLIPLTLDLVASVFAHARKKAITAAHKRLGSGFIPLMMVIGTIACILWFFRIVL